MLRDFYGEKKDVLRHVIKYYSKTNSKDFQDLIADYYLKKGLLKHFIEIGAYDGFTNSNSLLLEERGILGVIVECNPDLSHNLNRRKAYLLEAAVVPTTCMNNKYVLYVNPQFRLSGAKIVLSSENKASLNLISGVEVCEYATEKFGASSIESTYLSIDIEGMDVEVLKEILAHYRPLIISIEHNFVTDQINELFLLSKRHGYNFIFPYLTRNDFFLRRISLEEPTI